MFSVSSKRWAILAFVVCAVVMTCEVNAEDVTDKNTTVVRNSTDQTAQHKNTTNVVDSTTVDSDPNSTASKPKRQVSYDPYREAPAFEHDKHDHYHHEKPIKYEKHTHYLHCPPPPKKKKVQKLDALLGLVSTTPAPTSGGLWRSAQEREIPECACGPEIEHLRKALDILHGKVVDIKHFIHQVEHEMHDGATKLVLIKKSRDDDETAE